VGLWERRGLAGQVTNKRDEIQSAKKEEVLGLGDNRPPESALSAVSLFGD